MSGCLPPGNMRTDGSVSKISDSAKPQRGSNQALILPTPPIRPILLSTSTRLVRAGFR